MQYQGMQAGLSKAEALNSTPGEIADLVACKAISQGARQRIHQNHDQLMGIL